jgi:hypothetical protein
MNGWNRRRAQQVQSDRQKPLLQPYRHGSRRRRAEKKKIDILNANELSF